MESKEIVEKLKTMSVTDLVLWERRFITKQAADLIESLTADKERLEARVEELQATVGKLLFAHTDEPPKVTNDVCHVCGKPATKRMGPDLVEPDSGIRLCDDEKCKIQAIARIYAEEEPPMFQRVKKTKEQASE